MRKYHAILAAAASLAASPRRPRPTPSPTGGISPTASRMRRGADRHGHAGEQPRRQPAALAMFEAVNAIDRRYQSYLDFPAGDHSASVDAAAATAAYKVLHQHFPAQRSQIEESYALTMQGLGASPRSRPGARSASRPRPRR